MAGRHAKKSAHEPDRRKRRLRIVVFCTLAGCVAAGAGTYYALTRPLTHASNWKTANQTSVQAPPVPTTTEESERTNILLIGTDTRPGQTGGNSDVLILCSIDRKHKRIELMSIPRDTRVMFPDGSYAKINEGLSLGGPMLTESLVNSLIQQPIDHYALTHFGGLVDIIDTIGGVPMDVEKNMYYRMHDQQYNVINLHKGYQTLSGEQALGYVRFRHDALGDIGRTERQQKFLKALANQLLQPENIAKLPTLVRQFWGTIDTDMNLLEVIGLAAHADEFRDYEIIHETLPGSFHDPDPRIPNDASYWIVNPLQAKYVAQQFFEDGIVVKNPVQDPAVTDNWQPAPQGSGSAGQSSSSAGDSNGGASFGSIGTTGGRSADSPQSMVATASAYIRSGPGQQYRVIASVLKGQKVWVVGTAGGWYIVQIDGGRTGYIAKWLLSAAAP
jgi:LCP family protein required for cell wall assembly